MTLYTSRVKASCIAGLGGDKEKTEMIKKKGTEGVRDSDVNGKGANERRD